MVGGGAGNAGNEGQALSPARVQRGWQAEAPAPPGTPHALHQFGEDLHHVAVGEHGAGVALHGLPVGASEAVAVFGRRH